MVVVVGILCVLTFNMLQGANAVYLSSFLQHADYFVVLFGVFGTIAIFFNSVLFLNGRYRESLSWSTWRLLIFLNITTAASWSSFFFAVKHIEPALSSSFINAVLPLATISMEYLVGARSSVKRVEVVIACALFVAMMLTAVVAFGGNSGMSGSTLGYAIGLGMSATCSIAMSATTVVSKRLNNSDITPEQIMAYRFLLLSIGAAVISSQRQFGVEIIENWLPILLVAVVGNLLPIYALQLGISRLRPVTVAFLIGLAPITVFFLQGFSQNISFSWPSLIVTSVTTLVVLGGTFVTLVRGTKTEK